MKMNDSICPNCGGQLPAGFENCQALFNEILALEYTHPTYAAVHLLTVDAYMLQHSEEHGPRSNAFHLMRLCWMLETGGGTAPGESTPPDRKKFEAAYKEFPFLEPPTNRGLLSVADVYAAQGPADYKRRVREWAQSVWDAWSDYHAWARETAKQLMNY